LFYRSPEESSLSEGTEEKQTKPEGFILALQATPPGITPERSEGVIPLFRYYYYFIKVLTSL
jgi:hypothetical protein